jgi:hypothetical protein
VFIVACDGHELNCGSHCDISRTSVLKAPGTIINLNTIESFKEFDKQKFIREKGSRVSTLRYSPSEDRLLYRTHPVVSIGLVVRFLSKGKGQIC